MNEIDKQKVHFFNLDILRFVAVAMVMVFHGYLAYSGWFTHFKFLKTADSVNTLSDFGKLGDHFFINLSLGVDLFFLISGFLITYLLLVEKGKNNKINISKFYTRRILRIWPLYFLIIAISPFLISYFAEKPVSYLWTCLFMNNFEAIHLNHTNYPFVHFWTISVEEHYYLLWPLLLTIIPIRHLPVLFATLIGSAIIYRACAFFIEPNWMMDIGYNTLTRGDVIVIGSLLAWIHYQKPIVIKISKPVRIIAYVVLLLGMLIESVAELNSAHSAVFKRYFFVCGFIFMFLNYMFNSDAFFNFKKKNILHYLGKISFGIYLIHNIIFPYIIRNIMWRHKTDSAFVFFGSYFAIVIFLAILSYELIEKRILRFKNKFAIIDTER